MSESTCHAFYQSHFGVGRGLSSPAIRWQRRSVLTNAPPCLIVQSTMREDLETAIRSLCQSPTFTVVALVVLAQGIGAGAAILSVVDAVVLRALPFDEHDRLAVVLERDPTRTALFGSGTTTA